ncbi:unnamed protein product [Thelazia callipaeda]|uniref:Uncharacterized protein n=1 Tax=Thelazia callipaeda TaxID=103827 RepID=A0A0N5CQ19_THECL|nr:unnamed protein product [Thelazia callipaeda]
MHSRQSSLNVRMAFIILLFSMLVAISDSFLFGNRNYIRFRRPEDVWEPPFRTILCDNNFPIRIQINADPEETCRNFMNQMEKAITYNQ